MATNRPSLLDDADLASLENRGKAPSGGGGVDRGRMAKIGAVIALFALAIVFGTYQLWRPEGPVRDSRGQIVQPRELTPEDEEALQRQERERELFLEQGGKEGSE
jgi:hypothetical protein